MVAWMDYYLCGLIFQDYDEDGGTRTNRSGTDDNQNISLEQCLDLFTEPEVLSPEHAW